MQMLVVPLVFCSLVCGSMAMGDTKKLGTIGVKTLFFYLFTTALAITAAILVANVINPGVGLDMSSIRVVRSLLPDKVSLPDTLLEYLYRPIRWERWPEGISPIILFALIVGIILAKLGESVETVGNFFSQFNDVMMEMTTMVMKLAPLRCVLPDCKDVFRDRVRCVSAASQVYGGRASGAGRTVSGGLHDDAERLYGAESLPFYQEVSACNGLCVFHGDLQCYNSPVHRYPSSENGGVSKRISSFTIPLGATINMDGTAIMQGVAVVFAAQAFGISLSAADYITVILTATLASIGTAGVPGVGLITLSMVFHPWDFRWKPSRSSWELTGFSICAGLPSTLPAMLCARRLSPARKRQ